MWRRGAGHKQEQRASGVTVLKSGNTGHLHVASCR